MGIFAKARIVRIGNSRGLRIQKRLLEQARLTEEVQLELRNDEIVIRSVRGTRAGWDAEFQAMAAAGEDCLLDPETPTAWDREEWEW